MNKRLLATLALGTTITAGCVSLPGEDATASKRFRLKAGDSGACQRAEQPLKLSVIQVAAGLDNDRVARLNANTGEITYLKDLRWVTSVSSLVEQGLAEVLECAGYAVQTGHRSKLGSDRLECEVRALNLTQNDATDRASVGLSCLYTVQGSQDSVFTIESSSPLQRWNVNEAMAAFGLAFSEASKELVQALATEESQ